MYEVKMKICDLDKPNRNGRIYPKELFENKPFQLEQIPVALNGDMSRPIGKCTVTIDYPTMEIDSVISTSRDILKRAEPALHGKGKVNKDGIITEYYLECIDLVPKSANNSTIESVTKIVDTLEEFINNK